jgi:hypothetical protein
MDATGQITDVLALEAKCLAANSPAKIRDAHEKVSAAANLVSGVFELVSILNDYATPEAEAWQKALLEVWRSSAARVQRYD